VALDSEVENRDKVEKGSIKTRPRKERFFYGGNTDILVTG